MRGRFELVTRVPRALRAIWAPTQAGEWIESKTPAGGARLKPSGTPHRVIRPGGAARPFPLT